MKILYIGDIMGQMGIQVVEKILPELIKEKSIDLVIAQAENVSEGKGITINDYQRLKDLGVDFFTGGNWTLFRGEIIPLLKDIDEPIIRPANYPLDYPGLGFKYISKNGKKVLVVSLLGKIVGKDSVLALDNPLKCIDEILSSEKFTKTDAIVVNFHGDYSSEKVIIGHYLDGRVTTVIGDHWHVPTADARVLPKGTAHISDVGMCGSLDSSLGVKLESVVPRWKDNKHSLNILETKGKSQFNAVLVESDSQGLAKSISPIQKYF